jgi:hypothetical protein
MGSLLQLPSAPRRPRRPDPLRTPKAEDHNHGPAVNDLRQLHSQLHTVSCQYLLLYSAKIACTRVRKILAWVELRGLEPLTPCLQIAGTARVGRLELEGWLPARDRDIPLLTGVNDANGTAVAGQAMMAR